MLAAPNNLHRVGLGTAGLRCFASKTVSCEWSSYAVCLWVCWQRHPIRICICIWDENYLCSYMMCPADLPYGWDFLVENLMDPSHVAFSHHGILGKRQGPSLLKALHALYLLSCNSSAYLVDSAFCAAISAWKG